MTASKEEAVERANGSDRMNADYKFKEFISGLVAGVISVTVCNPLDIARTRLNIMVVAHL